ncbi:hypothetical protein G7Y89_g13103 [Cudoniella acicularis]|uniref:Uncharacterized protein n=1 Tax=Cudoniella acicularis TaxID=354080 RepID=A0A8H4VYJ9_9HELO|nr:hypothetical protein G7Y89_g13103 [Cudoniella acicularis]
MTTWFGFHATLSVLIARFLNFCKEIQMRVQVGSFAMLTHQCHHEEGRSRFEDSERRVTRKMQEVTLDVKFQELGLDLLKVEGNWKRRFKLNARTFLIDRRDSSRLSLIHPSQDRTGRSLREHIRVRKGAALAGGGFPIGPRASSRGSRRAAEALMASLARWSRPLGSSEATTSQGGLRGTLPEDLISPCSSSPNSCSSPFHRTKTVLRPRIHIASPCLPFSPTVLPPLSLKSRFRDRWNPSSLYTRESTSVSRQQQALPTAPPRRRVFIHLFSLSLDICFCLRPPLLKHHSRRKHHSLEAGNKAKLALRARAGRATECAESVCPPSSACVFPQSALLSSGQSSIARAGPIVESALYIQRGLNCFTLGRAILDWDATKATES